MEQSTSRPDEWRGSDLRSRAEVVQYLKDRGGEVADTAGLVAGVMRDELQRGRALAQLLADMESDGMIDREVRGRRTFRITLKDDWGLGEADTGRRRSQPMLDEPDGEELSLDNVDLTQLAETLLAVVVKRMTSPAAPAHDGPSAREMADRLRRAEAALQKAEQKLRERSTELTETKGELTEAQRQVRTLENNIEVLKRELEKAARAPRRITREVPLREQLDPEGRKALDALMRALPESPASRPRAAAGGKRS